MWASLSRARRRNTHPRAGARRVLLARPPVNSRAKPLSTRFEIDGGPPRSDLFPCCQEGSGATLPNRRIWQEIAGSLTNRAAQPVDRAPLDTQVIQFRLSCQPGMRKIFPLSGSRIFSLVVWPSGLRRCSPPALRCSPKDWSTRTRSRGIQAARAGGSMSMRASSARSGSDLAHEHGWDSGPHAWRPT
jgi:hypothetical protein